MCYIVAMVKTIGQRELRNDNAKVIDAVARGESFLVTRNGVPIAELRPVRAARRASVPKAQLLAIAASGPVLSSQEFRADLDKIVEQGL